MKRIGKIVKSFEFGWCLTYALVSMIAISPTAKAAGNDYSHQIGSACSHEGQDVVKSPTQSGGEPLGGWGGFMPLNASDGWELQTSFKVNRFGNAQFLRIAKIGTTYKIMNVVSGG